MKSDRGEPDRWTGLRRAGKREAEKSRKKSDVPVAPDAAGGEAQSTRRTHTTED